MRSGAASELPTAFEAEAETLAPHVARGAPVHASAAPQVTAATKKKEKSVAANLRAEAAAVEKEDTADNLDDGRTIVKEALTASTVGDQRAAEDEIRQIQAASPLLLEAIGTSWTKGMDNPSADKLSQNKNAELQLGKFLSETGHQSNSLGDFQQHYARLIMDRDRLDVMTATMGMEMGSGKMAADDLIKSQHMSEKDQGRMQANTDDPDSPGSASLAVAKKTASDWENRMTNASTALQPAERLMTQKSYEHEAQVDNIAAGLVPRAAPEAVKSLNELKEKLEKIKGYAKMATGFATKALGGYLGTAAGVVVEQTLSETDSEFLKGKAKELGDKAKDKVANAAPDLANDFIGFLVTMPWESDLAKAEALAQTALEEQDFHAREQQIKLLKATGLDLKNAVTNYLNIAATLEHAKSMYRRTMSEAGRTADRMGHGRGNQWETMSTVLAETDAYLAESRATLDLGHNEMDQADSSAGQRSAVTDASKVFWWSVAKVVHAVSGDEFWEATQHNVQLPSGVGSAQGEKGANDIIKQHMKILQDNHAFFTELRNRLAAQFTEPA